MAHAHMGAQHRSPSRLAIAESGVTCAITQLCQPMLRCSGCPHFQGMLLGPDPWVLCTASTVHPSGPRAGGAPRGETASAPGAWVSG